MTNNEYAKRLYCAAFGLGDDNGDVYVRGVFDVLSTLTERKRLVLECRYRNGMTYKRIGEILGGMNGSRARRILDKALRELRRPENAESMSVSKIIENKNELLKLLQDKDDMINELFSQISDLLCGEPIKQAMQNQLACRKMKIIDMGFPRRLSNALARAGIYDCDALLALNSFQEFTKMTNIGRLSIFQIVHKMRACGYAEWADKIEEGGDRRYIELQQRRGDPTKNR